MKRLVLCLITVLLLGASSTGVVCATTNPNQSLQLMYAKLQLEMSEVAKEEALTKMEQIAARQEEQKQVANFLNTAWQLQQESADTAAATEMPPDMAEYMDANSLTYDTTGGDLLMEASQWDMAITSLESRLEQLSAQNQEEMVYVQSVIQTYDSYSQQTNTQNDSVNQSLTNLARGQSMYGDSGAGLTVTALVVGLVLGCVLTLAAQKFRGKKGKA